MASKCIWLQVVRLNNESAMQAVSTLRMSVLSLVFFVAILFSVPPHAALSVGVDANLAVWEGDVNGNQYESDSSIGQYGINFKIKFLNLYVGADYLTGKYDFNNQAIPGIVTGNPDDEVTRTESNIVAGYYFYRYMSVFAKYKKLKFDNGEKYSLENPGLGIQLHRTLSSNWLVFTNAALFTGDFSINGIGGGDSDIMEYSAGLVFRPTLHSHLILNYKNQTVDYQYNNSDEESHTLSGLLLSYNYIF